jgi:hypothetical protein
LHSHIHANSRGRLPKNLWFPVLMFHDVLPWWAKVLDSNFPKWMLG